MSAAGAKETDTVSEQIPVRRALVSVYDKTGLEELGRTLAEAGVEVEVRPRKRNSPAIELVARRGEPR